jgi:hypothetical protein
MDDLDSRYTLLIEQLQTSADPPAGLDELSVCYFALNRVITFLQGDQNAVRSGAVKTLNHLNAALHDVRQGAKPPLIFKPRSSRRPTNTAFDAARTQIAIVACILIEDADMDKNEAGKFIENKCKEFGVRHPKTADNPNGKAISKEDVLRWRDQGDAYAPEGVRHAYRELSKKLRRGQISDLAIAKKRAAALIRAVALMGF